MTITYHGHSTFKIKGKNGTVVLDPFESSAVGFSLPTLSADVVTASHQHADHNAVAAIAGTSRRERPFVIDTAGEYEVAGISVFGTKLFHDQAKGAERGQTIAFTVLLDTIKVCHLGDLGHELAVEDAEAIGNIDVLLCPIGGLVTIDPTQAVKVIRNLEPSIVIPMHYRSDLHQGETPSKLKTLADFTREYGQDVTPIRKLELDRGTLPEETELVILEPMLG